MLRLPFPVVPEEAGTSVRHVFRDTLNKSVTRDVYTYPSFLRRQEPKTLRTEVKERRVKASVQCYSEYQRFPMRFPIQLRTFYAVGSSGLTATGSGMKALVFNDLFRVSLDFCIRRNDGSRCGFLFNCVPSMTVGSSGLTATGSGSRLANVPAIRARLPWLLPSAGLPPALTGGIIRHPFLQAPTVGCQRSG